MEPSFHFSQKYQLLFAENASQPSNSMAHHNWPVSVFKPFLAICQNLGKFNSLLVKCIKIEILEVTNFDALCSFDAFTIPF